MDHLEDFYGPSLSNLGYDFRFNFRKKKDSVLVGFKTNKFDLLAEKYVDYNDLASVYNEKEFLKHNKAVMVHLRHKETGADFIAASSHLHWNPAIDYVKYGQAMYLLENL